MARRVRYRLLPILGLMIILSAVACSGSAACGQLANPDGWAGGTVDEGILYTGTMDGTLVAIDTATGEHLWQFDQLVGADDRHAFYGDPILVGDRVYVAGYDGYLYALSRVDGTRWGWGSVRVGNGDPIVGGVSHGDGVLVVGSSDGSLYAFDAETGNAKWKFETDSMVWTTPLVSDGFVYFGSLNKRVYALPLNPQIETPRTSNDQGDPVILSEPRWEHQVGGAVVAPLSKAGNRLFVGAFDGIFYALDATTGDEIWRFDEANRWYWARALVDGDVVYAPSLDGRVYALSLDRGELIWRKPDNPDGGIIGSPVIFNDFLVVASDGGSLWTYSKADGGNERRCELGHRLRTNLVAVEDQMYVGAWDHTIRALTVNSFGVLDTEWSYKTDTDEPWKENPASGVSSC